MLCSQECGLYEASDILLSDHLCEKSQSVHWIAADQPHKRKRRLRDHTTLKELLESDPDSISIFNSNLEIGKAKISMCLFLSLVCINIGPRFVLNLIKIFSGSFGGPVLYGNPHYVSPNVVSITLTVVVLT